MGSLYFFAPLQPSFRGLRLLESLKRLMQRLFLKCLYRKAAFVKLEYKYFTMSCAATLLGIPLWTRTFL